MYESSYEPSVFPYGGVMRPSGQTTPAATTPAIPPLTDATPEQSASKMRVAITAAAVAAVLGFGFGLYAKMR